MNDRDPDGFVTLHHGRQPPLLEHFAWVLALLVTVVGVWNLPL